MSVMEATTGTSGRLLSKRELTEAQSAKKAELMEAGHAAFDADDFSRALDCYHRASIIDSADAEALVEIPCRLEVCAEPEPSDLNEAVGICGVGKQQAPVAV